MINEFFGSLKTLFQIYTLHGIKIYKTKVTQGKQARRWKIL